MNPFLDGEFSLAKITYEWHCAACNAAEAVTRMMPRGGQVYLATLPHGWAAVRDKFYCPRHKVETTVDGMPVSQL